MKKIYAFLLATLPVFGFAQMDIEWHSAQFQTGFQGDDIGFDYSITNTAATPIDITWQLIHERSSSTGIWSDYMCEGLFVCWPDSVRTNTFTLGAGEEIDMYHHIMTFPAGDSGTWVSTARIWVDGDSANTVEVMTATLKTGLKANVNGQTIYIVDGDSFELYNGNFVPLGINDINFAGSQLGQNAPNPFVGLTNIGYELSSGQGVMKFHDLTGKLVMEMPLNRKQGQVQIKGDLDAGIYFYSLWENGQLIDSKRMQVVR